MTIRIAPPYVGRADELAVLHELVAESQRGTVRLALIEGEAGIGKSRLLAELCGHAERSGSRSFTGTAEPMQADRPFSAFRDAFDIRAGPTEPFRAAVNQLLAAPSHARDPYRIADALVDLAENEAQMGPITIALEDIQWADAGTLMTVRALSKIAGLPVLVLATLRTAPRRSELSELIIAVGRAEAIHIKLPGLSAEESDSLVRQVAGEPVGATATELLSGAGGNPFFILEILATTDDTSRESLASDDRVPSALRKILLSTLAALGERTTEVLRFGALLGSTFEIADLATVSGMSVRDLLPSLSEALANGVLIEDADRLRFRHDLLREAIYDDLPVGARDELHRDAARLLAADGAPFGRVAEHLVLSAQPGDREAVDLLYRAALETTEPSTAVSLLSKAASLLSADDPDRAKIDARLASAQHSAGRIDEAITTNERLLESEPPSRVAGWAHIELSKLYFERRRVDDALNEIRTVLALPDLTPRQRFEALRQESGLLALTSDALAIDGARRAMDVAPDPTSEIFAVIGLCQALFFGGRHDEVIALVDTTCRSAELDDHQLTYLCTASGWAHLLKGEMDDARVRFLDGTTHAERCGMIAYIPRVYEGLGQLAFTVGDWDEALLHWGTVERHCDQYALYPWPQTYIMRAYISASRDDLSAARRSVHEGIRLHEAWDGWRLPMLWTESLVTGAADVERGAAAAEAVWHEYKKAGRISSLRSPSVAVLPHSAPFLVEIVRMLRDGGKAHVASEIVGTDLPTDDAPTAVLSGDPDQLLITVERLETSPPSVERAWVRAEAAAVVHRRGSRDSAKELFEAALRDVHHLEAVRPARAIRALMRTCDIRPGARGSRRRATHGWAALTSAERDVVALAAQGLTNPQIGERLFISKRTVGTHLANVFRKLDISSREDLRHLPALDRATS